MTSPKGKLFAILIAVLSLVGMILLFATDFAAFWTYSGPRYSCLAGCEYGAPSGVDTAGIIIGAVLLILQLILALNAMLPTPFLKKLPGMKLIPLLGIVTIAMMVMGIAAFGGYWSEFDVEWWPEAAFYGGLIAGVLNTLLAVLSSRMK